MPSWSRTTAEAVAAIAAPIWWDANTQPNTIDPLAPKCCRHSAIVGGTVATNAGGVHVLRYGPTRRQLVGIEAVLADGRVVRRLDEIGRAHV